MRALLLFAPRFAGGHFRLGRVFFGFYDMVAALMLASI